MVLVTRRLRPWLPPVLLAPHKQLEWKVIRKKVPVARYVGVDRAPTVEEVRGMVKGLDKRSTFVVLAMASSGIRVGAGAGLGALAFLLTTFLFGNPLALFDDRVGAKHV